MIVDEPYTINEKFGNKHYQITVDSPGWGHPINHYSAECPVNKPKKIRKLKDNALIVRMAGLSGSKNEWQKLEIGGKND